MILLVSIKSAKALYKINCFVYHMISILFVTNE